MFNRYRMNKIEFRKKKFDNIFENSVHNDYLVHHIISLRIHNIIKPTLFIKNPFYTLYVYLCTAVTFSQYLNKFIL